MGMSSGLLISRRPQRRLTESRLLDKGRVHIFRIMGVMCRLSWLKSHMESVTMSESSSRPRTGFGFGA